MTTGLKAAADRIELGGKKTAGAEAAELVEAIRKLQPDIAIAEEALQSVEDLLHIADRVVPGWSIVLRGKALEPEGNWRCTLRETTSRDSDEFIGHGEGTDLPSAILAAILRVIDYQAHKPAAG